MKIGFIRVSLLRKAPLCPREHGEREKKKAYWGLWEEKIIAVYIGIPSGSLDLRRSRASVLEPMTWSVNFPYKP